MKLTDDLTKPFWIHFKGILLAAIGILAGLILVMQTPSWETVLLYATGTWGFCRFYYYLFHVLERYLGGSRYTGILDQIRHLIRK